MSGFQVFQRTGATAKKLEKPNLVNTPNWLTTEEFARLCNITERAIRKRITEKRYKKIKDWINSKGNPAYKIHYTELPTNILHLIIEAKMAAEKHKLAMQPDEYDAESAWNKWEIIKEYFTEGVNSIQLAKKKCLPERTIQRWISRFKNAEDGRKMAALSRRPRKDRGIQKSMTEYIEQAAAALYLRQQRPTAVQVYRQMQEMAKISAELPSLKSVTRFLNSMPLRLKTLAREGERKYRNNFDKIILRDLNSYEVRGVYVGDHHQFDVFVEYRGRLIRPWITAWMDFRTRCITGYTIAEKPSSESIATSLRNAITGENSPFYGIPDMILIDNGKDYRGRRLNGEPISFGRIDFRVGAKTVLSELNIKVKLATPYNARTKPIERWFRTMELQFGRKMKGWCGNKLENRPESLQKEIDAFYKGKRGYFNTLDKLREDFRSWLYIYHDKPHAGLNNITPGECWKCNAPPPRIPTNQTLSFLLMKHECKVVSNGGIRIFGTGTWRRYYWHPALVDLVGNRVDIRFDPQDISKIYIFQGVKFICIAECRELIGSNAKEEDLRTAIREQRRIRKQDKKRIDDIISYWKEPDPILQKAAKRGEKKQEGTKKLMAAAAIIHTVPEYEGNIDRKSLKNAERLNKDNIAEYIRPLSVDSASAVVKQKVDISDDFFNILEGDINE